MTDKTQNTSVEKLDPEQVGKLQFPCDITVKAMGNQTDTFASEIYDICKQHVPELQESDMHVKNSSSGKYASVNLKINAKSREQLEKLYQALNDHPDVHMTL
jgi:putative lipoic acid-binding regulatory protein